MSLVCWKCWGVLHINNLLLGHFGPSKTITMMAIMLKWTQYLQRWWTNFTQGTSDTQWQIYNWDYKVKRWSIRQRQRSLTALWYEKFIFPPAPQSDAQLVAVLVWSTLLLLMILYHWHTNSIQFKPCSVWYSPSLSTIFLFTTHNTCIQEKICTSFQSH